MQHAGLERSYLSSNIFEWTTILLSKEEEEMEDCWIMKRNIGLLIRRTIQFQLSSHSIDQVRIDQVRLEKAGGSVPGILSSLNRKSVWERNTCLVERSGTNGLEEYTGNKLSLSLSLHAVVRVVGLRTY